MGAVCVLVGQCDPASTPCGNWWSWASPGSGWGWSRRRSGYTKLKGADTLTLDARAAGARHPLLGSTIVGLEHHTPENIDDEIEHAVAHDTDFHQFMLYTPVPGTPLYAEMHEQGRMLEDVDLADIHGQHKFNFPHAAISRDDSKSWLDWAFRRDFERNGPSLYRICRTSFEGWKRYKGDGSARYAAGGPAKRQSSGTDTVRRFGRWSGT